METSDWITLTASLVSLMIALMSVLLTLYLEKKRKNEWFEMNRGELFLYVKAISDRQYLVLENIGKSSLEITEIYWKSKILTCHDIHDCMDNSAVFGNANSFTFKPNATIKHCIDADANFNTSEYVLCVKYKTLGKIIEQKKHLKKYPLELKIVPNLNSEYGWESVRLDNEVNELKSFGINVTYALKEIANEISSK